MDQIITNSRAFVETYQDYVSLYHQRQRKYSLYEKEAEFLVIIYELAKQLDEVNMMHLAKKIGLTPGAISQTASRAERKGYIRRSMSSKDRRANVVSLTAKGQRFCEGYERYIDDLTQNIKSSLNNFSEKEIESFIKIQSKLTEAMNLSIEKSNG